MSAVGLEYSHQERCRRLSRCQRSLKRSPHLSRTLRDNRKRFSFGDGTDKPRNRLFKLTQSTAEFTTLATPMAGPLRRVSQNYHWTLKRARNDLHNSITPDLQPAPASPKIDTIVSPWDVSAHLLGGCEIRRPMFNGRIVRPPSM